MLADIRSVSDHKTLHQPPCLVEEEEEEIYCA